MLVLALESSTSSAKALLFDTEKGVLETADASYASEGLIRSQGVTDTDGVFRLTARLGRRLAQGRDIAAIALCGTFHSMAVCESDMSARDTYSWNYMAPSLQCAEARKDEALVEKLYTRTGCYPHVTYMRHTLRYLADSGMKLTGKKLISQGAYNLFQLTGEYAESVSTASGSGLLNIHSLEYDDFALAYAGVDRGQLGGLVTYRQTFSLSEKGAQTLGLHRGIPVVPAHPDGALNQIANGAAVAGRMTLSVGTSGAVRLTAKKPVIPPGRELWNYYGVTDWLCGAAVSNACNCIDWFRESCLQGRFSFEELERGGESVRSMPVFLPFVFGERCPGWRDDRQGGFVEVSSDHSLAAMYRALQAGILFNLYQCYETLCRELQKPEKIIVSGGILNSAGWTQMIADIFEQDIVLVKNINASSLGAAVLGAYACGAREDVTRFTEELDGGRIVSHRPERSEFYRRQYERYLHWYDLTK